MMSTRLRYNLIALGVTLTVNCLLSLFTLLSNEWVGILIGWGICPLFGGIFRTAVAHRKDLTWIIPGMFILDVFVLVPGVIAISGTYSYSEGMIFGLIAAVIMTIVSIITLLIRLVIERKK